MRERESEKEREKFRNAYSESTAEGKRKFEGR